MAKDLSRKAQRRARRPTDIDDDLAHLAEVLAEHSLDNNAYNWFKPPWRDGEWAMKLARHCATLATKESFPENLHEIVMLLDGLRRSPAVYEEAGRLYQSLIQPKLNTTTARLYAAALRCLQIKIANSHGGGTTYNEILLPAFIAIEPALIEEAVLEFRCYDAIGLSSHLAGDSDDRLRHAFKIAWRRGLYFAAYSIRHL